MKVITFILIIYIGLFCIVGISIQADNKMDIEMDNILIYKNTPAWELAQAVKSQNTGEIEKIIKSEPNLLNYQDPKFGATLLLWAVGSDKYRSTETLLKCGADPEIATTSNTSWGGITPLFQATVGTWEWIIKDPKYVKLLLRYGANPNHNYSGFNISGTHPLVEPGISPLMHTISRSIKKTKVLVEAGADINYKTKSGRTAAYWALLFDEYPEYAYYLIVERKAKITEPYYKTVTLKNEDPNEKLYLVNLLRYWIFDLNSKEYKMKMAIVDEFTRQGVNYWETKIHPSILEQIKKRYPKTWEEYIKKY